MRAGSGRVLVQTNDVYDDIAIIRRDHTATTTDEKIN